MTRKQKKAPDQRPSRQTAPSPRRKAPPPSRNELVLRERILHFTYSARFNPDFERAIRLYFGPDALQDGVVTVDDSQIPGFQEWYVYDYVTAEGGRIIDLFAAEKGPRLPAAQQQMLDQWRRVNRLRLFEAQKVEPGIGVTVQDLLSGELLEVNDISSSYAMHTWQVFLARPLLTLGRLNFAGSMVLMSPLQKPALLDCAQALWQEYQAQHPQALLDDFYRDRSLDLLRCQNEIRYASPPEVYTAEGHPVAPCTAHYTLADLQDVVDRLDEAEEFLFVGPAEQDEAALGYVWVLTGRSHVPGVPVTKGIMLKGEWWSPSGEVSYRTLGDLRLWPGRLELICLSRERLEAGKTFLGQVLGGLVHHVRDEYRDLEQMLAAATSPRPEPVAEIDPVVERRIRETQIDRMLDAPEPKMGGTSLREAARDPAMRKDVEEWLKAYEYFAEERQRRGERSLDVADIRRRLGLPDR